MWRKSKLYVVENRFREIWLNNNNSLQRFTIAIIWVFFSRIFLFAHFRDLFFFLFFFLSLLHSFSFLSFYRHWAGKSFLSLSGLEWERFIYVLLYCFSSNPCSPRMVRRSAWRRDRVFAWFEFEWKALSESEAKSSWLIWLQLNRRCKSIPLPTLPVIYSVHFVFAMRKFSNWATLKRINNFHSGLHCFPLLFFSPRLVSSFSRFGAVQNGEHSTWRRHADAVHQSGPNKFVRGSCDAQHRQS